jgi:DNA-directed RNA polymerase specialized sigma24 family protein
VKPNAILGRTDRLVWMLARKWAWRCDAEPGDVAQAFRLLVLEKGGAYDPAAGAVTTWVWRVCEAAGANMAKAARVRRRVAADAAAVARAADPRADAAPDHGLLAAELSRRLGEAVAALPGPDREFVTRRYGLDGGRPLRLRELKGERSVQLAHLRNAGILEKLRAVLS